MSIDGLALRSAFVATLAIVLAGATGQGWAQPPGPGPAKAGKPIAGGPRAGGPRDYAIAFASADIAEVANAILGEELGLSFVVDPSVSGKMSFRVGERMTPDQLLASFESALALSDVVIVRDGPQLVLTPRAKAKAGAGLGAGVAAPRGGAGYQVKAVSIRNANASDVAKSLEALGPPGLVASVDDRLGIILLSGTSQEIQRAVQAISLFDRGGLEASRTRLITLKSASAQTVADDVSRLVKAAGISGLELVPVDRMNAIIIIARSTATVDQVGQWVAKLDTPSREEATALWVFRPRNVSADSIAQALGSVTGVAKAGVPSPDDGPTVQAPIGGVSNINPRGQAFPALSPTPFFNGGDLKIGVEKEINALLVMAPEARWLKLKAVMEDLDRPPDQVLIEATVLEVTLDDEFSLGVNWSVLAAGGRLNIVSSHDPAGAVAPTFPGVGVTYLDNTVKAVVDALGSKTKVQVVSSPKLVTLDNRTAQLQVGDQVPVINQSSQSTAAAGAPLVVNTEYRDTGVILKIKPRISGEKSVVVELTQEVSAVANTTTSSINSPTIQQRKFETVMNLNEGETAALGGLISTGRTLTNSGTPFLKDVPVLGALFKTSTDSKKRTEIIVLLTAKILKADDGSTKALNDVKANMEELGRNVAIPIH